MIFLCTAWFRREEVCAVYLNIFLIIKIKSFQGQLMFPHRGTVCSSHPSFKLDRNALPKHTCKLKLLKNSQIPSNKHTCIYKWVTPLSSTGGILSKSSCHWVIPGQIFQPLLLGSPTEPTGEQGTPGRSLSHFCQTLPTWKCHICSKAAAHLINHICTLLYSQALTV